MAFVRWNQNTQIWELAVSPENPSTLFNHLPVSNPTLPLDIANKAYVDAAIGGVSGFVPYVGANQHVNLGAQQLSAGVGVFTGTIFALGGIGTAFSQSSIEIQGVTPRIAFHWPGVIASQIGMDSAGTIRTFNNPGTDYENFAAKTITSNGNVMVGGNLHNTAGYIYPGRIDAGGISQGAWYLASHAGYGLYTNTGMFFNNQIFGPMYGLMDPNYLIRETNLIDFTPDPLGSYTINANHGSWYMRHNGVLFVSWMCDVTFPNTLNYAALVIPGGFVSQRYSNSTPIIIAGGAQHARAEVMPGNNIIYCYLSNGGNFTGAGRFAGQIAIWVG